MKDHSLERVEQYLDGGLSEEDKKAFEQDLGTDKDLQKQFKFVQFERAVINTHQMQKKMKKIEEWDKEYHKGRRQRKIGLIIAATFIFALLLWGIIRHIQQPEVKVDNLVPVATLYKQPADLGNIRNIIQLGEESNNKDEELTILRKYSEAHQLFQNQQYEEAESIFRSLISDVNYGLDAEWFAILSYYAQQPESKSAIPILDSILRDDGHPHYEVANKLVEILK